MAQLFAVLERIGAHHAVLRYGVHRGARRVHAQVVEGLLLGHVAGARELDGRVAADRRCIFVVVVVG